MRAPRLQSTYFGQRAVVTSCGRRTSTSGRRFRTVSVGASSWARVPPSNACSNRRARLPQPIRRFCCSAKRVPAKSSSPRRFTNGVRGAGTSSCASTARRFRARSSRASCSGGRKARSLARWRGRLAASSSPIIRRSFSTRSATCRPRCRSSCFACSRNVRSSGSAARRPCRSTSGLSPRPTEISKDASPTMRSARTSITASTSFRSRCRLSASGPKTFRCWCGALSTSSGPAAVLGQAQRQAGGRREGAHSLGRRKLRLAHPRCRLRRRPARIAGDDARNAHGKAWDQAASTGLTLGDLSRDRNDRRYH